MRKVAIASAAAMLLTGCGGGGGGEIGSTPTPPPVAVPNPPPPPPLANSLITDLRASQDFRTDAAQLSVSYNLVSRTTISARSADTTLTVGYDAATASYTLRGGVTETFAPAEKQAATTPGEDRYVRRTADLATYLTLLTEPYTRTDPNRYVAIGYWQRNTLSSERQDTSYTSFVYGFDTPVGGVPRLGSGTFGTDVFGLESVPGLEPAIFSGRGRFDVDFANGLFSTSTLLTREGLISGNGVVGGGIELTGGGRLSATGAVFSGQVVYGGSGGRIGGSLAGRFFGPGAEEIGASFSGALADGSAFAGSLTGRREAVTPAMNISFARMVTQQLFYPDATTLTVFKPRSGGAPSVFDYPGSLNGAAVSRGQLTDRTSGNVTFSPPTSNLAGGNYTVASIVPGDPNFTSYAQTVAGQPTRLRLYRTGADNRELALNYASFGAYSTEIDTDPLRTESSRVFFVYGFNTPSGLFGNRTGTGSYVGVAYGAGANPAGTFFDVTGTARMTIDFGAQSVAGGLSLLGRNGATTVDYGGFDFAGRLFSQGSVATATIGRPGGAAAGSMLMNFYGPGGEEAGGIFRVRVPDGVGVGTLINGATVLKQQ